MEKAAITSNINNVFFLPILSENHPQKTRPKELNAEIIITPATASPLVRPLSGCNPKILAMGIIIEPAAVAHMNANIIKKN